MREITCQVDLVVLRQLHHGAAGRVTFTMEHGGASYGFKQEEVNGSDRLIYLTPLTSEACVEAHSLFNMSLGPASLSASALLLGVLKFCLGKVTGSMYCSQNNLLVTF